MRDGYICRAMPEVHCRSCQATFSRPLLAPYGRICPHCLARGEIVTLTEVQTRHTAGGRRRNRAAARKAP